MTHDSTLTRLLVTSREAAKLLSISERTLWSLAHSGELKVLRIGRSVRYAVADIEEYIDRRRSETFALVSRASSTNKEH